MNYLSLKNISTRGSPSRHCAQDIFAGDSSRSLDTSPYVLDAHNTTCGLHSSPVSLHPRHIPTTHFIAPNKFPSAFRVLREAVAAAPRAYGETACISNRSRGAPREQVKMPQGGKRLPQQFRPRSFDRLHLHSHPWL